ncbi:hypothetical protein P3F83_17115 [Mycobacteroides immunogenum]|uniref:hypothetical protein n=1 Tax=Mycobacteroides immunogenum TaxID=83262 RepID=UPI0025B776CC|nr:hypothetical protein [Mycobacteroides immunogenum]WJR36480.1 hypothetical protein P3F83_17115 [Mycobacteroides immunogenum]
MLAAAPAVLEAPGGDSAQRLTCSVQTDKACIHLNDPHMSSAPDPDNKAPLATVPATKTRPTVIQPGR